MDLQVELISGDVTRLGELDFLLIGHKNPLRADICRESAATFNSVDSESWMYPHQYELLESPSYKWKKTAAIKFRSNGEISETQFVRISSPISTALKQPSIRSIGILPPTWHNPQNCALGVIYSLWIIGYAAASNARSPYPEIMKDFCPNPANTTFKIVSQSGIEYFEEVLKDDCSLMWDFVRNMCSQNDSLHSYRKWREVPVTFKIEKYMI